ncbi:MAG: SlyX family protein [Sulfuricellaceae bacterium]
MMEARLTEIEVKITYQEDIVQELNMLVYQQQKRIEQLEKICESLMDHVRSLAQPAAGSDAPHEKPPHY